MVFFTSFGASVATAQPAPSEDKMNDYGVRIKSGVIEEFTRGQEYTLIGFTDNLTSKSKNNYCRKKSPVTKVGISPTAGAPPATGTPSKIGNIKCELTRGSDFRVLKTTRSETTIVVTHVYLGNVGNAMAKKDYVYTHPTDGLLMLSKDAFELSKAIRLKIVLVPQKFYKSSKEYSSNPTFGVGLSISSEVDDKDILASFTLGVGFTQATIDTPSDSDEKTGFSYFVGWDFINPVTDGENSGLAAGIYLGRDAVSLDAGETFNGGTSEKQTWWGIVLSKRF
jgi:hypothetical protein